MMVRKLFKSLVLFCVGTFPILAVAQTTPEVRVGDFIDIDGWTSLVIQVDDNGQGLAMTRAVVCTPKGWDKLYKKGKISQATYEKAIYMNYEPYKAAKNDKNNNRVANWSPVYKKMTESGEENKVTIATYCQENNIDMATVFPNHYWASRLGEGWFIPGDKELEILARMMCAGKFGKDEKMGPIDWINALRAYGDETYKYLFDLSERIGSICSSTVTKPEDGPHHMAFLRKGMLSKRWAEIFSGFSGNMDSVLDCASIAMKRF